MKPVGKNKPKRNTVAMTLIELLVVIVVVVILIAMLIPALSHQHGAMRVRCIHNLKQIGLAFRMWANDNGDKFPMQVSVTNTNGAGTLELIVKGKVFPHFQVMSNELCYPSVLTCPDDAKRIAATNFTTNLKDASISYFVGVDADLDQPTTLLSGDANFEIGGVPAKSGLLALSSNAPVSWTAARHQHGGNIAIADGSVQQVTPSQLRQRMLPQTGLATNRLLLP